MHTYTTKSGSVLEIKPVSGVLIQTVLNNMVEPEVPTYQREGTTRLEPNPGDPTYIKAVEKFKTDQAMKINDAMLINGVRVVALGPDKQELTSEDWADRIKYTGVTVPDNGVAREAAWLRYHIIDDGDLIAVITAIGAAGGLVTEEQVAQAVDSFRDNQTQPTDTTVPAEAADGLGHTSGSPTGAGDGVRVPTGSEAQPVYMDRLDGPADTR